MIQRPSISSPHGPTIHRNQGLARLPPVTSQTKKQMELIESQLLQAARQAGEKLPWAAMSAPGGRNQGSRGSPPPPRSPPPRIRRREASGS